MLLVSGEGLLHACISSMNLNPKKCKEMVICPLKISPDLDSLSINDIPLDRVSSHKLLGLKLMDTLKWNDNPRANGAKRRSGRKPGARVTNFVLAELKVVARDR